jgi:5-(carboxyamino)imidazole ribonucleotide synthase
MKPHPGPSSQDRAPRRRPQRPARLGLPAAVAGLGIIGGGQLARMTAMSALKFGCDVVVLERNPASPAATLATHALVGDWEDGTVLRDFASRVDVVTLENEFVDAQALEALERNGTAVWPRTRTIALVQDKYVQKRTLEEAGIPVVPARPVDTVDDLYRAVSELGLPVVLKSRRGAYDGRGNLTIRSPAEIEPSWRILGHAGQQALYVEAWCPFTMELATIVTRGRNGTMVVYPVVETVQRDHICHLVRAPARVSADAERRVLALAGAAAEAVGIVGSMGVECFLTSDDRVVVNELAPRVHNSGHYTIEACVTSQFENHVRAVLGFPLGSPRMVAPAAVMANLLGSRRGPARASGLADALRVPGAHVHLYGKLASGPGRKLGHVTALGSSLEAAEEVARRAAGAISFGEAP